MPRALWLAPRYAASSWSSRCIARPWDDATHVSISLERRLCMRSSECRLHADESFRSFCVVLPSPCGVSLVTVTVMVSSASGPRASGPAPAHGETLGLTPYKDETNDCRAIPARVKYRDHIAHTLNLHEPKARFLAATPDAHRSGFQFATPRMVSFGRVRLAWCKPPPWTSPSGALGLR
jgi:hypothetical protein